MRRNFRRLLCLFVDISITPLTRRKVECKFGARVRDPSRALRDFMRLSGHFPLESPLRSLSSKVTKNRLRLGGTILDISSLRAGSDLYGESVWRALRAAWERASERRPFPLSRAALAWLLATPSSLRGSPPFGRGWDVFSRLPLERWLFTLFSKWRACWQARIIFLSVKLSSWGWNLKYLLCLVFLQNIPKTTFSRYYYLQRDLPLTFGLKC